MRQLTAGSRVLKTSVTVVAFEPIDFAHFLVCSVRVSKGAPVSGSMSVLNDNNENKLTFTLDDNIQNLNSYLQRD